MDVEKTMRFILEQQAQFSANIREMREQQANSARETELLRQSVLGLRQSVQGLSESMKGLSEGMKGLS